MFIEIEQLRPEPLHIHHVYGLDDLSLRRDDAALEEPVQADFVLTHHDRDLQVQGTVRTSIRCQCARCLALFERRVASNFNLLYLPHPEVVDPEEEIELEYEDLDVGFYDGLNFDVDLMVLEQIELSLPMKFVCKEGCKGLCPTCGADLNVRQCECKIEASDPRLAALLDFRRRMNKSRDP